MKKFCLLFIALIIGILGARFLSTSVSAQASGSAQAAGITFPLNIPNVGTCENKGQCRQLCDDPVNRDACVAWATARGFYKQDSLSTQKSQIIAAAKNKLGCDGEDSCRAYCETPANFTACTDFAKSAGLQGGYAVPSMVGEDDKKALTNYVSSDSVKIGGLVCNSLSCVKQACDRIGNITECTALAQKAGLRGGVLKIGPGGCTSANTCRKYCSDPTKADSCTSFGFKGPGGCDSQNSCVDYCKKNPGKCSFYKDSSFKLEEPKGRIDPSTIEKVCADISQIKVANGLSGEELLQKCVKYMRNKAENFLNATPRPLSSPLVGPANRSPFPNVIYSPSGETIYNLNSGSTLIKPTPTPYPYTNSTGTSTSTSGDKASPSPSTNTTVTSGGSGSSNPSPTPTTTNTTNTTSSTTNTLTNTTVTSGGSGSSNPSPTPATAAVQGVKTVAGFFQRIFGFLFGI